MDVETGSQITSTSPLETLIPMEAELSTTSASIVPEIDVGEFMSAKLTHELTDKRGEMEVRLSVGPLGVHYWGGVAGLIYVDAKPAPSNGILRLVTLMNKFEQHRFALIFKNCFLKVSNNQPFSLRF